MKQIKRFTFTSGTLEKLSFDFYNLYLFNDGKVVYKVTLPRLDVTQVMNDYDNIKMVNNG